MSDVDRGRYPDGRRGACVCAHEKLRASILAGTIGVISPSGNEVGPFLPIEQAALSEVLSGRDRTTVFGWYALTARLPPLRVLCLAA